MPPARYEFVDLPKDPGPVPAWAKGIQIQWYDGYGNDPRLEAVHDMTHDPGKWDNQVWECVEFSSRSVMYLTQCEDGRAVTYWHRPLEFIRGKWMTPEDSGLGGAHIPIRLKDGREAILRGPWCSSGPASHQDICFRHQRTSVGRSNIFLRDAVVIAMVARFMPDLKLARVHYEGPMGRFGPQLQPLKPEWNVPKALLPPRRAA